MTTSSPDRTPVSTFVRERWVALVLVILTAAFVAQNRNRVDLNLFWMHMSMPLWLVLVIIALVGAVIGFVLARLRRR